ncbi:pQP509L [African swine fever virus]|uniref:PQP509L n=1 Tax=African swine fever virus TaxID=10497 RepID=A0A8A1V3J8_ASF|nr:pQP509L [African swine fever virus]
MGMLLFGRGRRCCCARKIRLVIWIPYYNFITRIRLLLSTAALTNGVPLFLVYPVPVVHLATKRAYCIFIVHDDAYLFFIRSLPGITSQDLLHVVSAGRCHVVRCHMLAGNASTPVPIRQQDIGSAVCLRKSGICNPAAYERHLRNDILYIFVFFGKRLLQNFYKFTKFHENVVAIRLIGPPFVWFSGMQGVQPLCLIYDKLYTRRILQYFINGGNTRYLFVITHRAVKVRMSLLFDFPHVPGKGCGGTYGPLGLSYMVYVILVHTIGPVQGCTGQSYYPTQLYFPKNFVFFRRVYFMCLIYHDYTEGLKELLRLLAQGIIVSHDVVVFFTRHVLFLARCIIVCSYTYVGQEQCYLVDPLYLYRLGGHDVQGTVQKFLYIAVRNTRFPQTGIYMYVQAPIRGQELFMYLIDHFLLVLIYWKFCFNAWEGPQRHGVRRVYHVIHFKLLSQQYGKIYVFPLQRAGSFLSYGYVLWLPRYCPRRIGVRLTKAPEIMLYFTLYLLIFYSYSGKGYNGL